MNNDRSKGKLQQRARGLIAGTRKHFSNESLSFEGAAFVPATLVRDLQALIDAIDAAKAKWEHALQSMKGVEATMVPVLLGYRRYVVNRFGNAPSTLEDFGIARKGRLPLTAEQKAAAALKRDATRKARHTMGTRQRAQVKAPAVPPLPVTPPKPAT